MSREGGGRAASAEKPSCGLLFPVVSCHCVLCVHGGHLAPPLLEAATARAWAPAFP